MTRFDDSGPDSAHENGAAGGRAAALGAAILRIDASLDLEAVLGAVVESARARTGARSGVIATVDQAGVRRKGIVFSGLTGEEQGGEPRRARQRAPVRASPRPAGAVSAGRPRGPCPRTSPDFSPVFLGNCIGDSMPIGRRGYPGGVAVAFDGLDVRVKCTAAVRGTGVRTVNGTSASASDTEDLTITP